MKNLETPSGTNTTRIGALTELKVFKDRYEKEIQMRKTLALS